MLNVQIEDSETERRIILTGDFPALRQLHYSSGDILIEGANVSAVNDEDEHGRPVVLIIQPEMAAIRRLVAVERSSVNEPCEGELLIAGARIEGRCAV